MPIHLPLLSNGLRGLGYATHLIGKWHLGFCRAEATPTGRGFDTFYGIYNSVGGSTKQASVLYFNHFVCCYGTFCLTNNITAIKNF